MTVEAMRGELLQEYPGDAWRKRVMDMPDYQVLKVYTSIRDRRMRKPRAPFAEQMSFLSERGRLLFK